MKTLVFKWTVSRGRNTYGYNICSLWVDGQKVASCNGGGYDMQGTCLADYILENYRDRLMKLKAAFTGNDSKGFYGLSFHKNGHGLRAYTKDAEIYLNGACGFSSMERIAKRIGLKLEFVHSSTNETICALTDKREGRA